MQDWTLDDIDWSRFDPTLVDPETVKVVKAASLVEHNGWEYARYLQAVFHDDADFRSAAQQWAREEVQHGLALRRWAELADPRFDFETAFRTFTEGYRLPLDQPQSVRGSRAGELIARCIVETATSSWYAAIADTTREPVLKQLSRRIATDELRHYKLFYSNLRRYLTAENIGRWERLRVAAGRMAESEDDELSYAYFAANGAPKGLDAGAVVYDRRVASRAYARRAYAFYRQEHVDRGVGMIFKAVGLDPQSLLRRCASKAAWWFVGSRSRWLEKAAA
jgi:rubrerythrin